MEPPARGTVSVLASGLGAPGNTVGQRNRRPAGATAVATGNACSGRHLGVEQLDLLGAQRGVEVLDIGDGAHETVGRVALPFGAADDERAVGPGEAVDRGAARLLA